MCGKELQLLLVIAVVPALTPNELQYYVVSHAVDARCSSRSHHG